MKILLKKRLDLKLILMSSIPEMTIFQDYYNYYLPVIEIEMKQDDIRIVYLDINKDNNNNNNKQFELINYENIINIIEKSYEESNNSSIKILIFLPDINTIMSCKRVLNSSKYNDKYEIEILHISFFFKHLYIIFFLIFIRVYNTTR